MGRLKGKRAIITGAASGIGAAGAAAFAREGAHVVCVDIDEAPLRAVVRGVRADGGSAIAVRCDVTDDDEVAAAVQVAHQEFGGLDAAWANAGTRVGGKAGDASRDDWDRALLLNLTSAWITFRHAIPLLQDSGTGSMIFTASAAGGRGTPNVAPYSAAKGGVIGLMRAIAVEYAEEGVRSNAILPGLTHSAMMEKSYAEQARAAGTTAAALMERAAAAYPLRRLGAPDDHANLALYLASDESTWMTGHAIPVDGGRYAKY
ncbi:SDR family NAD(P)-dependent oxidoreductase [Streptomyces sp. WG-D5]